MKQAAGSIPLLLLLAFFIPQPAGAAQGNTADEIVDLINGLRASYRLAPYTVDPVLMAMAQEHSEYQAANHVTTHLHSDGSTPPDLGVAENISPVGRSAISRRKTQCIRYGRTRFI